jgi:AraC-like DNA-binding protein
MFWTGREGQLCVQHFRPAADVFYPTHVHSEYTVVVCLAGEVVVKQLGQEQTIGPGEALLGNYGVPHSSGYRTRNGRPCEAVSISLDRRLMSTLTADFKMISWGDTTCPAFVGKVQGGNLLDCAQAMARELTGSREGQKVIIETQASRLLVETMRMWPQLGVLDVEADSTQRLPRREFIRAYEFMRWCRKQNFRLQPLCRFLGTSEERFTRLFLASTHQTPAAFYNRMLLERACELLADRALSVKEIAFELGFKTSSHFVTAFRRHHAISPQKYREQGGGLCRSVIARKRC